MSETITLPWPPSVNTYWRTPRSGKLAGMTMLSVKAREYRKAAVEAIGQRLPITSRTAVSILLCAPTRRSYDLDNHVKAILDALTHAHFWLDDSQVDRLTVVRGFPGKPGSALVKIEEMSDAK